MNDLCAQIQDALSLVEDLRCELADQNLTELEIDMEYELSK